MLESASYSSWWTSLRHGLVHFWSCRWTFLHWSVSGSPRPTICHWQSCLQMTSIGLQALWNQCSQTVHDHSRHLGCSIGLDHCTCPPTKSLGRWLSHRPSSGPRMCPFGRRPICLRRWSHLSCRSFCPCRVAYRLLESHHRCHREILWLVAGLWSIKVWLERSELGWSFGKLHRVEAAGSGRGCCRHWCLTAAVVRRLELRLVEVDLEWLKLVLGSAEVVEVWFLKARWSKG